MIEARGLRARLGAFELGDVTFTVPEGGYGVVIGPAGSGKTTLLETIAGVIPAAGGELRLAGRDVRFVPTERRETGLVYQHGFLFPHLSVLENVRYGARDERSAQELIERFEIGALLARDVVSLSGGERQLVSLARTLARRPAVLLLDEPFSALDPRRRARTRREVRALHRAWGFTALQVTHDFTEAGLLGDVAILLDAGRVLQFGPPEQVFRRPASPYIAEFLGAENVYAGTARVLAESAPDWLEGEPAELAHGYHAVEFRSGPLTIYTVGRAPEGPGPEGHRPAGGGPEGDVAAVHSAAGHSAKDHPAEDRWPGEQCYAVIRAEEVVLSLEPPTTSARNHFRGRITELNTLGAFARVTLDVAGTPIVAAVTTRSAHEMGLREGTEAWATFKAMAVHLC